MGAFDNHCGGLDRAPFTEVEEVDEKGDWRFMIAGIRHRAKEKKMANLNRVFLMGNLTRDPDVRRIPSGKAVADVGLAINRKFKSQSGEEREETCFVDVVVWDKQAEVAEKYLRKGSPLFVEGRLKLDQWETEGEKRSKLRVVAERIQLIGGGGRGGMEPGNAPDFARGENEAANPRGYESAEKTAQREDADDARRPADGQADEDDLPF